MNTATNLKADLESASELSAWRVSYDSVEAMEEMAELLANICEAPIVLLTHYDPLIQVFYSSDLKANKYRGYFCDMVKKAEFTPNADLLKNTDASAFFSIPSLMPQHSLNGFLNYPLLSKDNRLLGCISIFTANIELITQPKAHMLELLSHNLAREIEHEFSWLKVEDKIHTLQEANLNKDKFLSILSHDMRTPFNGIIGYSELLLDELANEDHSEAKHMAADIYESANVALTMMDNLLKWSLHDANKLPFNPTSVFVPALLSEVYMLVAGVAVKKSISLEVEGGVSIDVFVDKDMILSVLQNLLSNAIKFTPVGGGVKLQFIVDSEYVVVRVIDTGVGMSEDRVRAIFDLGSMHSSRGTSGEMGTGLGLLLCKQFVEKNSGIITVESEQDKGTSFSVFLPRNDIKR